MSVLPDLESMDRPALLALWSATLGGVPPAKMSQPFLRRVLAWELQAKAQGGLPVAVQRRLAALAAGAAKPVTPAMKSGGRLLREWNGITHVVDAVEGGFLWRGGRYRSLSAIARVITGAHWSGPRFFGLQEGAAQAGKANGKARCGPAPATSSGAEPLAQAGTRSRTTGQRPAPTTPARAMSAHGRRSA